MPIPQLKSQFSRHTIGDRASSFSRQPMSTSRPAKKRRGFFHKINSSDNKSPRTRRKLWRRLLPYFFGAILIFGIFVVGLFAWYSRDLPQVGKIIDRPVALSTKIYDRTGETLLYEVHGDQNRTLIAVGDLPDYIKQSTIAIEDKDFYKHGGISLRGIVRSQIMPLLKGQRVQGGSTLTQQFVKNAILSNERKLSRKIKEWILSYQIEKKFSKDQILEFYLNEIPYGSSAYGIESAAKYYFGKTAKDLTLGEAAVLAALPQAPSYYSPYGNNKDKLIDRQHVVLNLMVEQGYIDQAKADAAKAEPLNFKKRAENILAPHFVMYVRELLEKKYGASTVEQSGWIIRTSLDWEAQQKAEKAITDIAVKNQESFDAGNASLVALDVNSGEILAMVGSKDYFDDDIDGQVNVALSPRQPGSSLKPFVYLAAFTKGYRPDTILFDLKTKFGFKPDGTPYEPNNYDLKEHGPVTMRQALAGSLNIPAVKTLYLAGVYNVLDWAQKFGYTTLNDRDRYGLSLVLGGGEVKLLEHVNAYATLAREGVYKDTIAILDIKDSKGKEIEKAEDNDGHRIIEKEPVRSVVDVMSDNSARAYIFGESNYLTLPDRPVAAKTGTTNDYHDAWTLGFTPDIATGVWVGNSDNKEMKRGADGSVVAAPIWNRFMREMTSGQPVKDFKKQDLEPCSKPMVCGQLGAEQIVKIDKMSGKLATQYTPYTTIEEKKYMAVHNILQYVNINDPLGDAPTNPASDPQYQFWEDPVQKWAQENGYTSEQPPTDSDDIHLPELQPTINWVLPSNNQTITQANIGMRVTASAPRGIRRVEYFVDDKKVGESYSNPSFDFNYSVDPFLANGSHTLKAMAFDEQDNFKETTLSINLQLDSSAREFNLVWLSPASGTTILAGNLPINLEFNIDQPSKIDKIDFYYIDPNNDSHLFSTIQSPSQNKLSMAWGAGRFPGVYKIYLAIKTNTNNQVNTPPIVINVE